MSARGDEDLSKRTFWERLKESFYKERDTLTQNGESEEETGWQRVRALFDVRQSDEHFDKKRWRRFMKAFFKSRGYEDGLCPEMEQIRTVMLTTTVFAFVFGGRFGYRIVDDSFRRHNHLTVYESAMHAQRRYHASIVVGFVKYGWRWGWRAGAFAGVYSFLVVALEAYRNRYDALNFMASGASTGVLYNILSGWRKMAVGAALGSGLSLPLGILAQAGNAILPEEYKLNRKQLEECNFEKEEQKQILKATTSSLIESIEKELKQKDQTCDHKR